MRSVRAADPSLGISQYLPETWILPEDLEKLELEWDGVSPLILKHGISARGEGISLTSSVDVIRAAAMSAEEAGKATVCSIYVQQPYLVQGRKFDLRIYVCVTSVAPLRAYVYDEGLARFCYSAYHSATAENLDRRDVHLTNCAWRHPRDPSSPRCIPELLPMFFPGHCRQCQQEGRSFEFGRQCVRHCSATTSHPT